MQEQHTSARKAVGLPLDYCSPEDDPQGLPRDPRALRCAVCGASSAFTAIVLGLMPLEPLLRRALLSGIALVGGLALGYAAHVLINRENIVDRALGVSGAALGGLSVFAAYVLF